MVIVDAVVEWTKDLTPLQRLFRETPRRVLAGRERALYSRGFGVLQYITHTTYEFGGSSVGLQTKHTAVDTEAWVTARIASLRPRVFCVWDRSGAWLLSSLLRARAFHP